MPDGLVRHLESLEKSTTAYFEHIISRIQEINSKSRLKNLLWLRSMGNVGQSWRDFRIGRILQNHRK